MFNQLCTVKCANKNIELGNKVVRATSFLERLKGLMFEESLKDNDGMIIYHCNSIHTFFMKFSLDLVFLSKENIVIKIIRNFGPWKFTRMYLKADKVLEMKAHSLSSELIEGDKVEILCIN